jgi:hypothetical protein
MFWLIFNSKNCALIWTKMGRDGWSALWVIISQAHLVTLIVDVK